MRLDHKDLRITTFKAAHQKGGWNTSDPVGVHITHLPTGINFKCESERSVHSNRAIALRDIEQELKRVLETLPKPRIKKVGFKYRVWYPESAQIARMSRNTAILVLFMQVHAENFVNHLNFRLK